MADRIKNYEINYNILSNASQAAQGFESLLGFVEKLSGKDPSTGMARGLTKLNGEINTTVSNIRQLTEAMMIRPELDMSGFKANIGQMQRAVAEFAQQTRNIMRMAMSGTDKQFAKAKSVMSGDIFDAASLKKFEEKLRAMPGRIAEAQRAVEKAKANYQASLGASTSVAVGATAEEIKNADAAAKREQQGLKRIFLEKQRELASLQKLNDDYQRQVANLRGAVPQTALQTMPTPAAVPSIPKGYQKTAELIPRWEKEYEEARALALKKRAELATAVTKPTKLQKPSFYDVKMPGGGYAVDYMRQYADAAQKYSQGSTSQARMMEDSRNYFMRSMGYNAEQFNEAYQQYQKYEEFKAQWSRWLAAGKPETPAYNQTEEYKNYRIRLKRLRAAYNIQRQAKALQARAAAASANASAAIALDGGGLPPVLGMQPQILEQAFTGKLTLQPDIAAARSLIAAEKFSANLNLVPLISELQAKLDAGKFSVRVNPVLGAVSGKGKGSGKSSTASAIRQSLEQEMATLKEIVSRNPIAYRTTLVNNTQIGSLLRSTIRGLQEIANATPITVRTTLQPVNNKKTTTETTSRVRLEMPKATPKIDVIGRVKLEMPKTAPNIDIQARASSLTKSIKDAFIGAKGANKAFSIDAKVRTGSLVQSIRAALASKVFLINAKISTGGKGINKNLGLNVKTPQLDVKVAQLERLRAVWSELPRTGSRTYTINLKTMGLENIARLERLIQMVERMPASTRRTFNVAAKVNEGNAAARGTTGKRSGGSGGRIYGGNDKDLFTRARAWAYPFTGNTSFGARTPAALDMMKGMGMMMGIGGAMGVIGSSFSDAVSYQNTMETTKAILRDNYNGNNFNRDYADMIRVVRDVAVRTKFTAPEAADAARFMAMAGLDVSAIRGAISPIADVAAISDMDLGMVADKMTNIMTTYKVNPENMRNLADMMTKTFTSTNTDMLMLAESLQYAGPMAFASGQSLAETLAMIGIMGNSGIQASMAGTTMRMMLQNIYNPNKKQAQFMESIGLKTRDANGKRRPLLEILSDVSKAIDSTDSKNVIGNLLSGKDEKQNIDTFEAASKLFRVTSAAGGASLLANIQHVSELASQIATVNGNSAAVSLAKQNTISGLWAQTKSAFTEAVVKVFEDNDVQKYLKDTLGSFINYLKQPEFIKTIRDLLDLIKEIGSVIATFVGYWVKLYQTFPNLTKWVLVGQMFFTQIGYLMTPFIQFIGLFSTFGNMISGTATALGIANRTMAVTSTASTLYRAQNIGRYSPSIATVLATGAVNPRLAKQYRFAAETNATRFTKLDAALTASVAANGFWRSPKSLKLAKLKQEAYQRRELYTYAANRSEAIRQRAKRIYGTGNRAYRALIAGLNGTYITSSMHNLIAGLRTAMSGIFIKGAGLIGTLFSPITLVTGALGALAVVAGVAAYNYRKQNEAWQEGIKNSGARFREDIQKSLGLDTNLSDVFENIKTINVNAANIHVNEGEIEKITTSIAKDDNLKSIYDALSSHISNRTDAMTGSYSRVLKGVSQSTFEEAYKQYVEPMSRIMPLPNYETFKHYLEGNGLYGMDEAQAASAIVQAIIGQKGTQSGAYEHAEKQVLSLATEYNKLPISEQLAQWNKYSEDIRQIAESFNPANIKNLTHITSNNFQNALKGSPAQYYEYWLGSYNSIMRYIEESPALKAVKAVHELNAGVEEKTDEWWNAIIDIVGATSFNDKTHPELKNFTIPVKNGKIDYSKLTQKLSEAGVLLENNVATYISWISAIYDSMFSEQGIAQQLNNIPSITKEELLRRLFGNEALPAWLQPPTWGNTQLWQSKEDRMINNYLGSQTNSDPNKNRPGYHFSFPENKWIPDKPVVPTPTPTPVIQQGNTTQQPKPTAYNSGDLNSGYENSYAHNAARPTQVIINIDKLMNTDKMLIASDAEERQLAGVMEDRIEQALDILKGQIIMSLQRGSYETA